MTYEQLIVIIGNLLFLALLLFGVYKANKYYKDEMEARNEPFIPPIPGTPYIPNGKEQIMNEQETYADYLYWKLYIKGHINFHAFMELFKYKFNKYPIYDYIITFKTSFHDEWYSNISQYLKEIDK